MNTEPRRPLPLAHELGQLWAQILVAEYQRRREVATTTVVTPSGSDRRAAQLDRMSPRHAPSVVCPPPFALQAGPEKSVIPRPREGDER
jgi:hypothetical protein